MNYSHQVHYVHNISTFSIDDNDSIHNVSGNLDQKAALFNLQVADCVKLFQPFKFGGSLPVWIPGVSLLSFYYFEFPARVRPCPGWVGHVRYINILAWLRGFRVNFFCPLIPKKDLDAKKTPNIEVWPENLGAMLEYWYIERGLFTSYLPQR